MPGRRLEGHAVKWPALPTRPAIIGLATLIAAAEIGQSGHHDLRPRFEHREIASGVGDPEPVEPGLARSGTSTGY